MTAIAPLAVSVLAVSGEAKKSGPIGLAVILVLCVACYFLFKSMSRHLRKVREEFPGEGTEPGAGGQQPGDEPAAEPSEPAESAEPDKPDGSTSANQSEQSPPPTVG